MKNNCPNCGAPLDPFKYKCEYCGTSIIDLGVLDLDNPCYVKFRTHDLCGRSVIVSALVVGKAEIEVSSEKLDVTDWAGNVVRKITTNKRGTIHMDLDCLVNPENESLYQIIMEDDDN